MNFTHYILMEFRTKEVIRKIPELKEISKLLEQGDREKARKEVVKFAEGQIESVNRQTNKFWGLDLELVYTDSKIIKIGIFAQVFAFRETLREEITKWLMSHFPEIPPKRIEIENLPLLKS